MSPQKITSPQKIMSPQKKIKAGSKIGVMPPKNVQQAKQQISALLRKNAEAMKALA